MQELRWGLIGTGAIASDFTLALQGSSRGRIIDVAGSSHAKAQAFAASRGIAASSATIGEMLANPAVDAVYIATPHPAHEKQALACITAKKHVLCEKPITVDAASAERVIEAARQAGVFLMEAYMYRCHPLTRQILQRLSDGVIGPVRHMRADFGFRATGPRSGRLFDPALGGGSILDVGGYPASFARLVAGLPEHVPFAEPVAVDGSATFGPTGVDELACAALTFGSGFTAEIRSAIRADLGTTAVLFGERGKIVVSNPWLPGGDRHGKECDFVVFRDGLAAESVVVRTHEDTYAIEAALVADTIPGVQAPWPAMSWDDTLGNMRLLERWLAALH